MSRWIRRRIRAVGASPRVLSLGLVVLVFGIDLCLPLGVASAVPYTFAVLLALSARPPWFGPAVAGLCGLLTVAKMEMYPDRGTTEMWKVVANRGLALFAIGMTLLLGILRRRADTERRRAEEHTREHQEALARLGRLSLLGQVAAGLAHELNQPLAAVCLQADLAARLATPGEPLAPELSAALSEIAEQSARAAGIVRSIRRMARHSQRRLDRIDLNDVARSVLRLLDWQARRVGATLTFHPAGDSVTTFGDRTQVEQVVSNLVQNAIEAVGGNAGDRKLVTINAGAAGDMLTLSVRDTGPGVADPQRVFEQFFTTKPDGLGLGLAISRSIVEAHGGRLTVAAAAGGGAVFTFTLPVAREEDS